MPLTDSIDTRDMHSRLRRLNIGGAQQARRNSRPSSLSDHRMPSVTSVESLCTARTRQRVHWSQTQWFDELAYGRRPQDESPAESQDDSLSEDAEHSAQSEPWYHPLANEGSRTGASSENLQRHLHQTENLEGYSNRDVDDLADDERYSERDNDFDVNVREWTQEYSALRTPRSRDNWRDTVERDVDLLDDTRPSPDIYPSQPNLATHQMDSEPNISRGNSNDAIEVLAHRLDVIQRSCLQAVREGVDKITDSINHLKDDITLSQSRNCLAPSRGPRKVKLTRHPIRRSNEARRRQKNIREHLTHLLVQAHPAPVVDEADANSFQLRWNLERDISCCTKENFHIDLNGTPKSAWNRSASRVFARSYCDFFNIPVQIRQEVLVDVAEGFLRRVKTLKYQRLGQSSDDSERMRLAKVSRRRTRKTTLFHRRLEAAERHPRLLQHVEILQRLGVDGMSSDESDYDELPSNPPAAMRAPRYYVLRPKWRHDGLGDWLETFDVVYNIMRRESLGRRGAYARRRVQSSTAAARSQSNSFVPQLPVNAYDQVWLSGRRDIPFSIIPTDAYNFTHDSEVFRYMQGTVLELPRYS